MRLGRLHENIDYADSILFVPAMLDMHFPLIKYAFYSKDYHPIIMDDEDGITDLGLKYTNHDMCYPLSQIVGQMIKALNSGKYDVNKIKLLMPTTGDACRGANYTGALRRAIKEAGYGDVPVLTLNVRDYEPENMMKFNFPMVWRAMFGLFYGDILMVLLHSTRPYEKKKGARLLMKLLELIQKDMIKALRQYGYFNLPPYWDLKKEAHGLVNYNVRNADGWLIGAEAIGYINHGIEKVFAAQPFGCMVNHCAGRGLYPSLTRRLGKGHIVSSDVDASASKLNYYNRLLMLLHGM